MFPPRIPRIPKADVDGVGALDFTTFIAITIGSQERSAINGDWISCKLDLLRDLRTDLNLRYLSRASLDATTATTCAAPATGGSLDRLGGKDFQDSR